jgi:hypothetical protein
MSPKTDESFNNLIDQCIDYEVNPEYTGQPGEIFRKLLMEYFFRKEVDESKRMENLFDRFEIPDFINNLQSMLDINMSELTSYINGETLNDSLCGKIMLSKTFLKAFYPGQDPVFANLSEDVKFELIDRIKEKNSSIASAFEKLVEDREADKKRKVITLISLIIKNVYKKSGRPLNKNVESVEGTINSLFSGTEEKFTGNQRQMAMLEDDTRIKGLVKEMFIIKQYKDIEEVANLYKKELERYKRRSMRSAG